MEKNNHVTLMGYIETELTPSYECFGEKFYKTTVKVLRESGVADLIPVTIPERLIYDGIYTVGNAVMITGEFRSFNRISNNESNLILSVFAKDVKKLDDVKQYYNFITLIGFICKDVVYRQTPMGREIADILLAVNRRHKKSDYLPCIAWGRNARFANILNVGDKVTIGGRIQSRVYEKKIGENETVARTAYEVSISEMVVEGE